MNKLLVHNWLIARQSGLT